jgi:hypothetical protein
MSKYLAVYFVGSTSPETKLGDDLDALVKWIKSGEANGRGSFKEEDCAAVIDTETGEVVFEQASAEGEGSEEDWNLFLEHNGVRVYHAIDGPRNDPWLVEGVYSMIPDAEKDGDHTFTATDLPQYKTMPAASDEEIIRAAIDAGDLTEDD